MKKSNFRYVAALALVVCFVLSVSSCARHGELYRSKRVTEVSRSVVLGDPESPLKSWVTCTACNGKGTCQRCSGTGKVRSSKCVTCNGTGRCSVCSGEGGYRSE